MANELVRGIMALVTGEDLSQDATEVPFTPTGTISATTVQTAVAEVSGDVTTLDGAAVKIAGTQTVTGAKTFATRVDAQPGGYAFYAIGGGGFGSSGSAGLVSSSLGAGAGALCAKIGTQVPLGSVHATARLVSFGAGIYSGAESERAFISPAGELESTVAGSGIVLRSPNGTRWRVTVSDAGALTVAPA